MHYPAYYQTAATVSSGMVTLCACDKEETERSGAGKEIVIVIVSRGQVREPGESRSQG